MFSAGMFEQLGREAVRRSFDPFGIYTDITRVQQAWLHTPIGTAARMARLMGDLGHLNHSAARRLIVGCSDADVFPSVEYDPRFQDEAWTQIPWFDVLKQYYLLWSRWVGDMAFDAPNLDEKTRSRASFWVRQWVDALAPTNYFWTNPKAIARFMSSHGESLVEGTRRLLSHSAGGVLPMVDEEAFAVGRDLAATPGRVVFRNDLLELIQYEPVTERVRSVPVVVIAPWINKYYILDLGTRKSLVRWLVEKGFTVFVTSWKNPGPLMRETTMDDYLLKGARSAVEAAREICGSARVHAVGYCIGGTLLSALMAWQARGPESERAVGSWTLFTTLVDFSNPGDVEVFIDEYIIAWLEDRMRRQGFLDADALAWSFRVLRPNHLIWHYAVLHYLYGEDPPPFDVLFWNMDGTRLPEAMHSYYLRQFYLANRMIQPDALVVGGRPIDLGRITEPLYAVGAEQDHIAPWKATFEVLRRVRSPARYVLATSGHILGIINPPVDPPKRRYWVSDATGETDSEDWQRRAPKIPGSWWDDWAQWLAAHTGPEVVPPSLGSERHPVLENAPGTYVLER